MTLPAMRSIATAVGRSVRYLIALAGNGILRMPGRVMTLPYKSNLTSYIQPTGLI